MTKTNTANETAPTLNATIVFIPEGGDAGRWLAVCDLGSYMGLTQEHAFEALQSSLPGVTLAPQYGGRCLFAEGAFRAR